MKVIPPKEHYMFKGVTAEMITDGINLGVIS
jgi:hypothetical protein